MKETEIALKTDVAQKFQLVNSIRKWTKFHLNSHFSIDKSTAIFHYDPQLANMYQMSGICLYNSKLIVILHSSQLIYKICDIYV
jgi:hypothetical protein